MNYVNSNLLTELMEQNETNNKHMTIDDEFDFYTLVSTGNRQGLDKRGFSLMDKGLGKLSEDKNRNTLYHFIISISLITRMCIENGMPSETAYTLSDLYIQEVDGINNAEKINLLHKTMVYDYTDKMDKIMKHNSYSRHVVKTIKYISEHLSDSISADDVADQLQVNKSYLCSLFKKETGMTIGAYVDSKKNETAIYYLINTDMSYIDISNTLGYKSYSYFVQKFKKTNGMTPSEYRRAHHMKYL
ncbi:MAG: AraC family transcriptional regulator [Eubacterium sp.]|nr:AraC family transcriptional regulator [Eubacterium sp.]